jgi:hypothetical protein
VDEKLRSVKVRAKRTNQGIAIDEEAAPLLILLLEGVAKEKSSTYWQHADAWARALRVALESANPS